MGKLVDSQIKTLVEEYGSGPEKTMNYFAKEFGVHSDTIKRALINNNIEIISTQQLMSKYYSKCNHHDYFENIDDEHKAYWLGFLAADGHLVGQDKDKICRIQFSLVKSDGDMVEAFASDLGMSGHVKYETRVRKGKEYHSAVLSFNSKKMCEDLIGLGLWDWKKLGNGNLINNIPSNLRRHFVRGVFDGDGSIQIKQRKDRPSKSCYLRIADHFKDTLATIEEEMAAMGCNKNGVKKSSSDDSHYVRWGGTKQITKIAKWFYEDATIFMKRKKVLFPGHVNIQCGGMSNEDKYNHPNWKAIFDSSSECCEWLIEYGFHQPKYDVSVEDIKLDVEDKLNANLRNVKMMDIIKNFSPHYWHSTHINYNAISDAWEKGNQSILRMAIEKIWNKKVVNLTNLLYAISRHFKDFTTVSIFKPWVARYVYDKLLPNGGVIIDPCMGWGGRLIGCIDSNIEYIGYDLNQNVIDSHKNLLFFLGNKIKHAKFKRADSSKIDFSSGDLLFTSPPYDNTELYYGIDSTKTVTKPIYENIFSKFSGVIALNIPIRHVEQCTEVANKYGRTLQDEIQMKTSSFMGREKTYEPILIFE